MLRRETSTTQERNKSLLRALVKANRIEHFLLFPHVFFNFSIFNLFADVIAQERFFEASMKLKLSRIITLMIINK